MTDKNRTPEQNADTGTDTHDTGNGMSSQSHWTGDEALSRGVIPASEPATDAGTALGGDPFRQEDDATRGIPEGVTEGDGRNETGTTFDTDPTGDKRL
ncbi:hypothetical protein [Deinococcus sp. Marseille-Q6407]|uniref:hypothetical protein n=1 Tax=Deinococcus sp. Marseille-Q6407 TaxID=2969223 RepID=UPI0021BE0A07|nr:hypothetical protein [Deinococcus sp. Marseille-Q6407]